jgi:tRNA dimethylallyltransferase
MSSSDASAVEQALGVALAHPRDLLAVVGPTGSGKTAFAVALAEQLGGEIVSADSVQIYRAFDVGSGKPSAEELARARHHLVSAIDPMDAIDAASWAERATRAIDEVRARGRIPIVCGGSFLWVKALIYGLARLPSADAQVRARHRALAQADGRGALHARLREVDPQSAARLHPNDAVRVSRALEVYEVTGRAMSAWQTDHGFARTAHRVRFLARSYDAPTLAARIGARVREWLASGWVEEVKMLLSRGYREARAMGSVGYAQVRATVDGTLPADALEAAIVRATRTFARRQRTWLKSEDVTWL